MKQLRIALYSPYLKDHLGGGERYLLTVAECLQKTHAVTIFLDEEVSHLEVLKRKHAQTFRLNLDNITYQRGPFGKSGGWVRRLNTTRPFDIFYYMTDGSFFYSLARHNIVHFQIPLPNVLHGMNRLKFQQWKSRVANSAFTKRMIEKRWGIPVQYVHYGWADTEAFQPRKKENVIVSVGRFFVGAHNKKHSLLIDALKRLSRSSWKLVLVGNVDPGEKHAFYVEQLRQQAEGLAVEIVTNAPFSRLQKEYGRAKFYWHAAGFGEDERKHPERVEHMGLSVVEAMAAGCVPIVVKKGGLPELIDDGKEGYLWQTPDELVAKTKALIKNQLLWRRLSQQAQIKSRQFDRAHFCRKIMDIISEVTQ